MDKGTGFHAAERAVRKQHTHPANRLRSISRDAAHTDELLTSLLSKVEAAGSEATIQSQINSYANLRCGAWYLPAHSAFRGGPGLHSSDSVDASSSPSSQCNTATSSGSSAVYFKSSDGHYGKWAFSTTRINLHMLMPNIVKLGGSEQKTESDCAIQCAVVVDATQHGKRFPDAMTKTIPTWAATMNSAIAPLDKSVSPPSLRELFLSPIVTDNEVNAIENLLPDFVSSFHRTNAVLLPLDQHRLKRPIRTLYLSANDAEVHMQLQTIVDTLIEDRGRSFFVLCLCASGDGSAVPARQGWHYVPGAADDHQSWSRGLTCELFWAHRATILGDGTETMEEVEARMDAVVAEWGAESADVKAGNRPDQGQVGSGATTWQVGGPSSLLWVTGHVDADAIRRVVADDAMILSLMETSTAPNEMEEGAEVPKQDHNLVKIAVVRTGKHGIERTLHIAVEAANKAAVAGRPIVVSCSQVSLAAVFAAGIVALLGRSNPDQVLLENGALVPYGLSTPAGPVEDGDGASEDSSLGAAIRTRCVSKEGIRQAQQLIVSTTGVFPSRDDMKQLNRYFLSCDAFGKNSY